MNITYNFMMRSMAPLVTLCLQFKEKRFFISVRGRFLTGSFLRRDETETEELIFVVIFDCKALTYYYRLFLP